MAAYNKEAVDQAIASSTRAGRHISGREAKLIHALLRGRRPAEEPDDGTARHLPAV